MKQIQGSARVKIKEYVHAWSEFVSVSLLYIFNFFPQINRFYYFTSLHGLQDVENHCAHLRVLEQCACVNAIYFAPVVTTTCKISGENRGRERYGRRERKGGKREFRGGVMRE